MSQLRTVLLSLALSLLFVSPTWAQGELTADIQHFSQNGDFTSFARVRSARILPQLRPGFSLVLDYGNNPLQSALIDEKGNHRVEGAVEHLFAAHLHAAFAPTRFFEVGLHMPVLQLQGYGAAANTYLTAPQEDVGVGTGDLRIEGRFLPLTEEKAVGIEVTPFVTLPTGKTEYLLGSGLPSFGVLAAVSKHWKRFHVAGHAGIQIQPGYSLVGDSFVFEDRIHYGFGVGVTPILDGLDINLELVGAAFIGEGLDGVEERSITEVLHRPLEVNLTSRIHLPHDLSMVIGGGPGLSPAVGTPIFRVYAGLGWAPSTAAKTTPRATVAEAVEEEVEEEVVEEVEEEVVEEVEEEAPPKTAAKPEKKDGSTATLRIGVTYRGKHLADTRVLLQEAEGEQRTIEIGNEPIEIEVPIGTAWTAASTRDCLAGTGATPVQSDSAELIVEMIPERDIRIDFDLRDAEGNSPAQATIQWNEDPECIGCVPAEKAAVTSGQLRQFVCEGEHEYTVESPGYRSTRSTLLATAGANQEVQVEMRKSQLEIADGQLMTMSKVYFEFASAIIQKRSYELLDEAAEVILARPDFQMIEIQGHTDSRGRDAVNAYLSDARANAVLEYIVAKGVERSRLRALGFGESRPIVANDTDENRALNRRVEFHINPDEDGGSAQTAGSTSRGQTSITRANTGTGDSPKETSTASDQTKPPAYKAVIEGTIPYVVQPGDYIEGIAAKHGTTVEAIRAANRHLFGKADGSVRGATNADGSVTLRGMDVLYVGETLRIPKP
jgi:outer membrane protein OmpA-like peptidoglycan-associated protein